MVTRKAERPLLPVQINAERLLRRIDELASIGLLDDGSCCRLAVTDADSDGRKLVRSWMEQAGLEVHIDQIGNMIGVQPSQADTAPVMTGSHLDTVATGGRYDGTYGVLAGLEVIETLQEAGINTRRPLAVTVFMNEEGARFQPDMMGSMAFAGLLSLADAVRARAKDGTVLADELRRLEFAGTTKLGATAPHAFVELHIEQGPVLDRDGAALGVVTELQGISWTEVKFSGVANHAGTTPMSMRHDAAYCASRVAVFVRDLSKEIGGAQVATVGSIGLSPGLINVIAREATLTIDLRNTSETALVIAEQKTSEFLRTLAEEEQVKVEYKELQRTRPVIFDADVVDLIKGVAADLQQPIRSMASGAGHDAQMIAAICPAAMIFVPSRAGISHSPREYTEPQHLELGANVLLHTMIRLAE